MEKHLTKKMQKRFHNFFARFFGNKKQSSPFNCNIFQILIHCGREIEISPFREKERFSFQYIKCRTVY